MNKNEYQILNNYRPITQRKEDGKLYLLLCIRNSSESKRKMCTEVKHEEFTRNIQ